MNMFYVDKKVLYVCPMICYSHYFLMEPDGLEQQMLPFAYRPKWPTIEVERACSLLFYLKRKYKFDVCVNCLLWTRTLFLLLF